MADNRERLFRVRDILMTTGEDHPITSAQIVSQLNSIGVFCDRKAVLRDIEFLENFGMDIIRY